MDNLSGKTSSDMNHFFVSNNLFYTTFTNRHKARVPPQNLICVSSTHRALSIRRHLKVTTNCGDVAFFAPCPSESDPESSFVHRGVRRGCSFHPRAFAGTLCGVRGKDPSCQYVYLRSCNVLVRSCPSHEHRRSGPSSSLHSVSTSEGEGVGGVVVVIVFWEREWASV